MLLSYLTLLPGVLAGCQTAPVATTLNGTYTGRYLAEFAQDLFLGIPFAQAGRLENPTPLNESWEGTRSAEWYGNICPVPASERSVRNANVTGKSDDCLNLNIIRPSRASLKNKDQKLPVAVWLYGGAFTDGFGADLNSNYSWVVQASVAKDMPIMAVTLNYRVGFFGFPGGEEIAAAGLTNLGLKDQRQALRWVRENIAAFGGDPDKITVWGQSAGGNSIIYQLLAYNGQAHDNLFRAAIMSSGSIGIGNTLRPDREDAIQGYRRILNETGCFNATDTIACLREAPLDVVYNAAASTPTQPTWWPTIDGEFLTHPPSLQLAAGNFPHNITLLLGTNDDEGFALSNLLGAATETEPELLTLLQTIFPHAHPTTLTTLLTTYPSTAPAPPYALPLTSTPEFCAAVHATNSPCGAQYRRLSSILGDFALIHGRRDVATAWAAAGQTAYTWRFSTWPTSFPIDTALESRPGFAGHGAEYAYFFRFPREYELYGNNPRVAEGEAHRRLMELVSTRVIAFVYGGDPNLVDDPDVPAWPKYTVENPSNLVLNATAVPDKLNVHVEPDTWRQEGMALWAKYPLELDIFIG
ncbi:hypothetical protein CHGG_10112 [Chaetomium globosum CBS 148.51]|uniref:Carboxylic ester hydrolase n=1 Tax=Chaetomium globosum (strain ATCC 6205 / CBS 148.51 / DSM 1962 / NBRC 6347 / NRRL 1970) TaxID=306901 RepID=Q2GPJ2_CHAGB|nr:uncharacterized protein CHGG_10112 [Chaetomium globosum CBS 148.51]EAQ83708.1 hypothetical protein CHGG_10112 [Chaetomium globosum CBS 148.51]